MSFCYHERVYDKVHLHGKLKLLVLKTNVKITNWCFGAICLCYFDIEVISIACPCLSALLLTLIKKFRHHTSSIRMKWFRGSFMTALLRICISDKNPLVWRKILVSFLQNNWYLRTIFWNNFCLLKKSHLKKCHWWQSMNALYKWQMIEWLIAFLFIDVRLHGHLNTLPTSTKILKVSRKVWNEPFINLIATYRSRSIVLLSRPLKNCKIFSSIKKMT